MAKKLVITPNADLVNGATYQLDLNAGVLKFVGTDPAVTNDAQTLTTFTVVENNVPFDNSDTPAPVSTGDTGESGGSGVDPEPSGE